MEKAAERERHMRTEQNTNAAQAEVLRQKIEFTRAALDVLIEKKTEFEIYYPVSLELDQLIEQYVELM